MKLLNLLWSAAILALLASCASSPYGTKVKEPFQSNAYESNNRFWRASGKGTSTQDNIARGKADIEAKAQLAGQVNQNAADVADKFQSLVRQVMNTNIADLRKMDEKKFYNNKTQEYTVFIAYEIKKNAMLRFMKKQAKVDKTIDERQREVIEKIVDEELEKADADDKEGDTKEKDEE
jgi:hypothetical protein